VKVLGSVLVPGVVATTHMPAQQTEPEVYPGVAGLEALLASLLCRMPYFDLIEVRAGFGHLPVSKRYVSPV
jgi:hypothetical protein